MHSTLAHTLLIMKYFLLFLLNLSILPCRGQNNLQINHQVQVSYELVSSWPQPSKSYVLGQPTGIGIDYEDWVKEYKK